MSPEERQLLQGLFDRMHNNANAPRDREAEQMIADNLRQQPYAPYLLSQTVIIQDQALQAANARLQQLEQQLQDQQSQPQQSGGFLSGLFGGSAARQPDPPPQQRPVWNQGGASQNGYPPQQQGGPWGQQGGAWGGAQQQPAGGGFLKGALGTAAGVAGGVLMAESIRGLFTGNHGMGGLGIASGVPGMGETVNNFFGGTGEQVADRSQDAQQDANENWGNGPSTADTQQDADQDQDDAQDMDGFSDDV